MKVSTLHVVLRIAHHATVYVPIRPYSIPRITSHSNHKETHREAKETIWSHNRYEQLNICDNNIKVDGSYKAIESNEGQKIWHLVCAYAVSHETCLKIVLFILT